MAQASLPLHHALWARSPSHRYPTGRIEPMLCPEATKAPHARIEFVPFVALAPRARSLRRQKIRTHSAKLSPLWP